VNRVTPQNEAKIEESLTRHGGFFKPIICRETDAGLEILGGQHRWEIAQRMGYTELPVYNLGRISDEKAKEISLIDNARYGADDTLALSELLKELGSADDLQAYLPYTDADLTAIFQSSNIALDDLELDDPEIKIQGEPEIPDEKQAKAPKTHTIMRFKVSLADAEKITARIVEVQKDHGFTAADDLTNAGDALVHLIVSEEG
jgi:ParB-like chromosome segregation protein Spo0J